MENNAGPEAPPDLDTLRELVREAEGVLARQAEALDEQERKSERMLQLGVGALAGGFALATFAAGGGPVDLGFLSLLALASTLNVGALLCFLDCYVGLRSQHEDWQGQSPRWLLGKAQDPTWTLAEHLVSVLASMAAYYDRNAGRTAKTAKARRTGIWLLLLAVIVYAGVTFYILGGQIHG